MSQGNLDGLDFDNEEIQEPTVTLIPNGVYPAVIVESTIIDHQSGAQTMELVCQIIDGPYRNRKVWFNQNWRKKDRSPNPIARGYFKQVREATGVLKPKDTAMLHNIPLMIKVEAEKYTDREGNSATKNAVKKFMKSGGQQSQVPAQPAAPTQPPAQQPAPQGQGYQQPASAGSWAQSNRDENGTPF